MVLSRTRIHQAKILLNVPKDQIDIHRAEAKQLIKILNFYYLSPVFLMSCGPGLQCKLEEKYGIKNRTTFCDVLMNLLTVPLCDEIFMSIAFIIGITLMCVIWLPVWQNTAFNNGYNTVYGLDDNEDVAFDYACSSSHYQQCRSCSQDISCSTMVNNTCQYSLTSNNGCNYIPSVYCPMVSMTGFGAVQNATKLQESMYVDPNSFVDNTYIIYMLFGHFDFGIWGAIICNRTIQGQYLSHWAQIYWIWSFVGILIGSIVMYIVTNCILGCVHRKMDYVDPENYRLVRVN